MAALEQNLEALDRQPQRVVSDQSSDARQAGSSRTTDALTDLLLAARDGDRLALGEFIRRSQSAVWRLCAYQLGVDHADEVTEDTYVRAYRAIGSFRGDSTARTWLLAIACRACIDQARRRRRRGRWVATWSPASWIRGRAEAASVGSLLSRVHPNRRIAFVLTQVLDLSYGEAADVLGCQAATIRSRVARTRSDVVRLQSRGD